MAGPPFFLCPSILLDGSAGKQLDYASRWIQENANDGPNSVPLLSNFSSWPVALPAILRINPNQSNKIVGNSDNGQFSDSVQFM